MPSRDVVDEFLAQRHVAFVGVSRNSKEFANSVYRHLRDTGRTMYPVHVTAPTIEGDPAFRTLADVPEPLDGVVVMVPSAAMVAVVQDAIDRGVTRVWLHRGLGQGPVPTEAVERCRAHGVAVVDGACPLMFADPVGSFHKVHRFFARRRFAA
ncbi:MAG TPA: CoA-binding protein [Acidimicrobiia bacterium]|nr:CoA-binding protein [Acidimicrobiia bacterium]